MSKLIGTVPPSHSGHMDHRFTLFPFEDWRVPFASIHCLEIALRKAARSAGEGQLAQKQSQLQEALIFTV